MTRKRWKCRVVAVLGAVWTALDRGLSVVLWSYRIIRKRVGLRLRTPMTTCQRIGPLGEIISPATLSVYERVCHLKRSDFLVAESMANVAVGHIIMPSCMVWTVTKVTSRRRGPLVM